LPACASDTRMTRLSSYGAVSQTCGSVPNWPPLRTAPSHPMSEGDLELLDALQRVVAILDELGAPYYVCGSVASMVFGEPRMTIDADIVARLDEEQAARLVQQLGPQFYANLPSIVNAIRHDGSFNLIHLATMVRVDVCLAWRSAFAQSQFERRIRRDVGTAEPLVLNLATLLARAMEDAGLTDGAAG
jgi:hypothetical protein